MASENEKGRIVRCRQNGGQTIATANAVFAVWCLIRRRGGRLRPTLAANAKSPLPK